MTAIFLIISLLLTVSAVGVVVFKNPIYSALCLIANLLGVACIFAMLDAHFLATVQVVVYAGAIMVLVLFVLMLLNIKVESIKRVSKAYIIASVFFGLSFMYFLLPLIHSVFSDFSGGSTQSTEIIGGVKNIGEVLYTKYVFPFEATSVLILAALVGAVMLGKRDYKAR
jgi:NADH-quinone oxidoreductase subunit J